MMVRGDDTWVEDIIAAIADIRADTASLDFIAFSAQSAVPALSAERVDFASVGGVRARCLRRHRRRAR